MTGVLLRIRISGMWHCAVGCTKKFAYENLVQDKFPHFYVISASVVWVSNLEPYNEVCHTTEHMVHNSPLLLLAPVRTSHILSLVPTKHYSPHFIFLLHLILSSL